MPNEPTDKQLFGLARLKHPNDDYAAAMSVARGNVSYALKISREWAYDPEVLEAMGEVSAEARDLMGRPTEGDVIRKIWGAMETNDNDHLCKLSKELREWSRPNGTGAGMVNNTLIDNRSVMVVTNHGTDDEWSAKLLAQQQKLIADAAEPIAVN